MSRIFLVKAPLAALYEERLDEKETEKGRVTGVGDECAYGSPVLAAEVQENWVRVITYYGYSGWMHADDLQPVTEKEWEDYDIPAVRNVIRNTADVVTIPSVKGARRLSLPSGSLLHTMEDREDGWTEVQLLSGETGFVPTIFLENRRFGFDFIYRPEKETLSILSSAARRERKTAGGNAFDFSGFLEKQYEGNEELFRQELVQNAWAFAGTQYRWAGRSSWGIDCSGLVSSAYLRAGVIIYRDASLADGFPLQKIENCFDENGHLLQEALLNGTMKIGDAVYFPGHIGMYLGEGKYLHSTARAGDNGVTVNSFIPGREGFRPDLLESVYAVGGLR